VSAARDDELAGNAVTYMCVAAVAERRPSKQPLAPITPPPVRRDSFYCVDSVDDSLETRALDFAAIVKKKAMVEYVADLFAKALDIKHVLPSDDFFEIGGSSLNALQVGLRGIYVYKKTSIPPVFR